MSWHTSIMRTCVDKDLFHASQDELWAWQLSLCTFRQPSACQSAPELRAHPSCKKGNQSGFGNHSPITHRRGNHLNEQQPQECTACFLTSVPCLCGCSKTACVLVRRSSGVGRSAYQTPERRGRRAVRQKERKRERDTRGQGRLDGF